MGIGLRTLMQGRDRSKTAARLAWLFVGLTLAMGALSISAPGTAHGANRALLGSFATETGEGAGKVGFGTGVAVNRTGVGGAGVGDVYVSNFQNARVEQFTAEGQFIRAFGWDVVASGEHNTGGFEICEAASSPADVCKAGGKNANAGALSNAEGIAVDPLTGNVFVADNGAPATNSGKRISVYSATGDFEGAFGIGVDTNAAALEFCTAASACQAGAASAVAGGLSNLIKAALTVGPGGHLYVGERGTLRINEFSFTLNGSNEVAGVEFVRAIGWDVIPVGGTGDTGSGLETCTVASTCKAGVAGGGDGQLATATPSSLAVDSGGYIYAVTSPGVDAASGNCSAAISCRVQKFNPDGTFKETFGPISGGPEACQLSWTTGVANTQAASGVAIDPTNQHVFIARRASSSGTAAQSPATFEVCEFDSTGVLLDRSPATPLSTNNTGYLGLAIGLAGAVYVNAPIAGQQGAIYVLGPPPPLPGAEVKPATNIEETEATLNGRVIIPAPGGFGYGTSYRFEYSADNGLHWTGVPIPDQAVGSTAGPVDVSQTVSELAPGRAYLYRVVASNGAGSTTSSAQVFDTLSASPSVAHSQALPVGDTTATLRGAVNPNSSPTTYYFEWGTTTAYGNHAPALTPFVGEGDTFIDVSAGLTGLKPGTTYHFRLVATSEVGITRGPDTVFSTNACPLANSQGLPDCRGLELVSPPDQGPVGESTGRVVEADLQFQTTADGSELAYQLTYGLPSSTASGEVLYRANRAETGWSSLQLTPPSPVPSLNPSGSATSALYKFLSPDLSCGFLASTTPLTTDTPSAVTDRGGANLYRRNADGSYTIVTARPPEGTGTPSLTATYAVVGAASDCSKVVFTSSVRFPGVEYSGSATAAGLYEWDEGTLRTVGMIPGPSGPTVATPALPGGAEGTGVGVSRYFRAVSDDASRIYFNATSQVGGDVGRIAIFLQEGDSTAVDVSQSETATPNLGARFQTASVDGSKVFFVANYGLTADPSKGATSGQCATTGTLCDLYEYDAETEDLRNLSATAATANPNGAVVEGVLDASEDGSHVYFAAKGQLVPKAGKTYAENNAGAGSYNIYLYHAGEKTYVTTLSAAEVNGDELGPGLLIAPRLATAINKWTSRTTPSGRQLVFQTKDNITDYDSGGVREAYLYDADADRIMCLSCRTDGEPSVGNGFTSPLPGRKGGSGVADLLHPRQAMSDDGDRVFFNARDALAPGAVDGDVNFYQWEKGHVSLLATTTPQSGTQVSELYAVEFVGASANGDSVFFSTPERLLPEDGDGRRSIYVARVGGGIAPPPAGPTPCNPLVEGSCQAPGAPPGSGAVLPGSSTIVGSGNVSAPEEKKQTKKKKKKKKKKQTKKQKKQAQQRYASTNRGMGR